MAIIHEETVDYRAMYHKMVNAAEDAINLLIKAQRECEEMYISTPQEEDTVSPAEEGQQPREAVQGA